MDELGGTAPVPRIPSAATRDDARSNNQHRPARPVPESWADLYKAEMPRLIRYLVKCFGGSDVRDAEDAAHNAFVELFTKWETIRSPRVWLRKVAFRQMLRQNPRAEFPLDELHEEPATGPASAQLDLHEETQAVLATLQQLPLAQRQVLALIFDGFSYREIAEITEISEPAVRKNAERSKRKMLELLRENMHAHPARCGTPDPS